MTEPEALIMDLLKSKLLTILDYVDVRSRFIYLDYPLYFNVGDLLINMATESFFAEHSIAIEKRYCVEDMPRDLGKIDDNVTFVMQGGGNFGDLWPCHQELRERIALDYPRNRLIILPQSVYFEAEPEEIRSCSIFTRHRNLHIFVRDRVSLATLHKRGLQQVTALPDMAHWLWGKWASPYQDSHGKCLYFFRRDKESAGVPETFQQTSDHTLDWSDCMSFWQKVAYVLCTEAVKLNGTLGCPISLLRHWYALRDSIVRGSVAKLSAADRVVTNRLHVMLLGLLLGQSVTAFDNSYGKLSSYVTTWLQNIPNLTIVSHTSKLHSE